MRSFVYKTITIPVAFKAIPCSRRAQLWNRQASIMIDLNMLGFRQGWCDLPSLTPLVVMPCAGLPG